MVRNMVDLKWKVIESPQVGDLTEPWTYPALLLFDTHMSLQIPTKYRLLMYF
jgi:hypothetical protein